MKDLGCYENGWVEKNDPFKMQSDNPGPPFDHVELHSWRCRRCGRVYKSTRPGLPSWWNGNHSTEPWEWCEVGHIGPMKGAKDIICEDCVDSFNRMLSVWLFELRID